MFVFLNMFVTRLLAGLSPTDTTMRVEKDLCGIIGDGNFTFLQISNTMVFEIIKATCNNGVIEIERGQSGTTPQTFLAGDCVAFRFCQAVIDELCDCQAGGGTVYTLDTQTPESLEVVNIQDGWHVNFIPYTGVGAVTITGREISVNLCQGQIIQNIQDSDTFVLCEERLVQFSTLVQEVCDRCMGDGGVMSVSPGERLEASGTNENVVLGLEPVFAGDQNVGGAIFNRYGQLISFTPGWADIPSISPDGSFQNATVVVSGGKVVSVQPGSPPGVVMSVSPLPGGGIVVGGTPADPEISLPVQGFTPGNLGPFTVNDKGIITGYNAAYTFYDAIVSVDPTIEVNLNGGNYEIGHASSGVVPGSYEGYDVNEDGHITAARNIHTPQPHGGGNFGGVEVDGNGHVISAARVAQWAGAGDASEVKTSGMSATAVSPGIVDITFDLAMPDSLYQIVVSNDNGNYATISNRTPSGFRMDMSLATAETFYVTVTAL